MVSSRYGPGDEAKLIWVYLEYGQSGLEPVSLELLGKGREMADQLGWGLSGLLVGHSIREQASQAIACGADLVWVADHPLLENFTVEAYTHTAYLALMQAKPSVFLLGATPNGRDLAGRLAVRLRTGLNADCTGLKMETDTLVSEVSGFGGGVLALIQMQHHRPQMATVRPGVFATPEPDDSRKGEVIALPVDLTPGMIQTRLVERRLGEGVDLRKAPVLVAGGRGMGGDFATLQRLAELLGGDVGATRPPVDEGHIERERQIGQTGVVCSPKVAICCGISGAFHFVVGIEKSDTVIAINTDPEAPIFESADYCVVGDVHQIIPALIAKLEAESEPTYA
jgi:electron transfer flavoprotein alpha subunit